jgi:hypothetical protein
MHAANTEGRAREKKKKKKKRARDYLVWKEWSVDSAVDW